MEKNIWEEAIPIFESLRPAFKNVLTFYWAIVVMMAFAVGVGPQGGLTEIMRILSFDVHSYTSLAGFFSSSAILVNKIPSLLINTFIPLIDVVKVGEYTLFAIDEIKIGKEGRKMPGVKLTHQSSDNNSKSEFIMGHTIMCIALVVKGKLGNVVAMPILGKILGGIKNSPNDKITFVEKTILEIKNLLSQVKSGFEKTIFVADALYCIRSFIKPLVVIGVNVISRVKSNAVAYYPAPSTTEVKRGRKKIYGEKVKLSTIFKLKNKFTKVLSPIPGETCNILYYAIELIPSWLGMKVKFLFVIHPKRGKIILLCTNTILDNMSIYLAYYFRFQIELTFKNLKYIIGAFSYHFWSKAMVKIKRKSRGIFLHKSTSEYKTAIINKINTYHVYIALAFCGCCINQFVAASHPDLVWKNFKGWLRTINRNLSPSIEVTSNALGNSYIDFISGKRISKKLKKFIFRKMKKIYKTNKRE